MTKVVFHRAGRHETESIRGSQSNSRKCEFSFDPEEWEDTHGKESTLEKEMLNEDGVWRCHHEKEDGSSRCIFHQPVDERDSGKAVEKLLSIIAEDESGSDDYNHTKKSLQIIGGKFGELSLNHVQLHRDALHTIDLRHSYFEGRVVFKDSSLGPCVKLDGSVVTDEMVFDDITFNKEFHLRGAVIKTSPGDVISFHDCMFNAEANFSCSFMDSEVFFTDTDFCSVSSFRCCEVLHGISFQRTTFQGKADFAHIIISGGLSSWESNWGLNFWNAQFQDELHFAHSEFGQPVNFTEVRGTGTANFTCCEFGPWTSFKNSHFESDFRASGCTVSYGVDFRGSTFEQEVEFSSVNLENEECLIRFEGSELSEGSLYQPQEGEIIYTFNGATLGDIALKPDRSAAISNVDFTALLDLLGSNSSDRLIENCHLINVDYSGFDFGEYRPELENLDWEIHRRGDDEIGRVGQEISFEENNDSVANSKFNHDFEIEAQLSSPEVLEKTYLKAKNGAKLSGDNIAESEFFVKEMRYKKERHRKECLNGLTACLYNTLASLPKSPIDKIQREDSVLKPGIRWFTNSFLELSCGYGERLNVVIVYFLLTIINFSLAYPLSQGISDGDTQLRLQSTAIEGITLIDVLLQSFYYSVAAFTTLGGSNYYPVGMKAEVLTGIESLMGSFLIALLVFSLGRKVVR